MGQIQEFLRKEALEAGKTSWSIGPVDERRALGRASHEVQRAEAEVDGQTGNLLETVWQGMLSRVQYHMKDESSLGLDGESFHAAHFVAGAGFITGRTWSPEKGT